MKLKLLDQPEIMISNIKHWCGGGKWYDPHDGHTEHESRGAPELEKVRDAEK